MTAKFQLKALYHLEDRDNGSDDTEVALTVKTGSIDFPPNKSVTPWQPITTTFKDILASHGATVRWDEKQVLVRFRMRSNMKDDGSSIPTLSLEALVLPTGTWEAIPEPKKLILSSNASSAIRLWSQDCSWYSPLPHYRLPTAPGIGRMAVDVQFPDEFKYRWVLQAAMKRSDHGRSVESKQEFESYLAAPHSVYSGNSYQFLLPNPFGHLVEVINKDIPGTLNLTKTFTRNGKVIHRHRTRSLPQPTQLPKFNTTSKNISLVSSVLPADAPQRLKVLTGELYNASIAKSTAKTYSTAASHVKRLEAELGRELSWPLSDADSNLLLAYLLDRGVKPNTVKSYLAGTRRLAMSKGVSSPSPQSDLAKAILKGYENMSRDPVKNVAAATHRPVTIPFLRLLGHASNKHWKGDNFDKLCFWAISVIGFWGSFRLGELLCDDVAVYSPPSDLLGKDVIHMSASSIAFWIRDPKVPKQYGDVVEIWSTPQFPDVDPFLSFSLYWKERNKRGLPLTLPLFLSADNQIFTHDRFNSSLKSLISHYTLELELSTNRWTGHSFRSGLPTLLQAAGFKEEDIKSWGRWASSVYNLYTRDIARRFEVQRNILKVMDTLKAHMEGGQLSS